MALDWMHMRYCSGSAHPHSVSRARGGRGQALESERRLGPRVSIFGKDEHLLHPSLLLPCQIHQWSGNPTDIDKSFQNQNLAKSQNPL